jgi:RNA-directed DNA polymerase
VARFLHHDPGLKRAWTKYSDELTAAVWVSEAARMQPAPAAASWNIPSIEFIGDLADWLGLDTGDLLWFADLKGMGCRMNRNHLRHYHYRALSKASGTLRLIEAPKDRLKDVQLQILHCILEKVPPHPSIHGFLKGRSIKTFLAPHVGRRVVLRMDLQDFFPTFSGARVQTFFRFLGYPETIADLLGGLCTNATPRDVWKDAALDGDRERLRDAKVLYSRPHLPQGAPTSPALATSAFTASIAGLVAWLDRQALNTHAMRTTLLSRVIHRSRSTSIVSQCTLRRSYWGKVSRLITTRRVLCVRGCGSIWRASSSTSEQTYCATTLTVSRQP